MRSATDLHRPSAPPPPGGAHRARPVTDEVPLDPGDAGSVYRWLAPAVLGYLRAHRVPEPEDVLGEVFLQVARDLPRFRGDTAALRRWVFTIAHHRMIDDARRRAVRPVRADVELPEVSSPAATDDIDPTLVTALAQLTDDQRAVIVLRFVADLPVADVARLLGRRPGAVKMLQSRGLERLAVLLGDPPRAAGGTGPSSQSA